jgi:hypothetical protein
MPNETARAKLFGPTPGEVRQHRNQERQQISTGWAQLKPFAGAVKAAANAGSAFGDVLGAAMGMQDPAMMRAMAVEKVKSDVMALGLDYSDPEQRKQYLQEVEQRFSDIGEFDMAENARQISIEDDMRERQMLVTEKNATTAAEEARIKGSIAQQPDSKNYTNWISPDGKRVRLKDGSPEMLKAQEEGWEPDKKLSTETTLIRALTGLEEGRIAALEAAANIEAETAATIARAEAGAEADIKAEAYIFAKADKVREQNSALRSIENEMSAMKQQNHSR